MAHQMEPNLVHVPTADIMEAALALRIQNDINAVELDEIEDDVVYDDDAQHIHTVQISRAHFRDVQIDFSPGFSERNAFLASYQTSHKQQQRTQKHPSSSLTQTAQHIALHGDSLHTTNTNGDTGGDTSTIPLSHTLDALSRVPVGSRLRFLNQTDCANMLYSHAMGLLATEWMQCTRDVITLQFEDVADLQHKKVHNSSGAVLAWRIKQEQQSNHRRVSRSCVRDVVDSWYMSAMILLIICGDFGIFIFLASHRRFWASQSVVDVYNDATLVFSYHMTLLVMFCYSLELVLRLYGYGCRSYLWRRGGGGGGCGCIEMLDSFAVLLSLLWTTYSVIAVDVHSLRRHHMLLPAMATEILRFVRVLLRVCLKLKYTPKCMRLLIRVNRQSYFDGDFDLDLCYIVYPRYLVMSWPSRGLESLYRNNIRTVAAFLDRYHGDNYLVFDLCKERSYDDMLFHGRVMRARSMADHSVCTLSDMFEFAQLAHLWLRHDDAHCAVIHCKGGKGRTGVMVTACLMYDYRDTTVREALVYFATMRTNLCKKGKPQGVEAPSQLRYCHYFHSLLHITDVLRVRHHKNLRSHSTSASNLMRRHRSKSKEAFYDLIVTANRKGDHAEDIKQEENDAGDGGGDEEAIVNTQTRRQLQQQRIDVNISGLKQSSTSATTAATLDEDDRRRLLKQTSNVPLSALQSRREDGANGKKYGRGQWETNNGAFQSTLALHERFASNVDSRHYVSMQTWLERQHDSTVMTQSLQLKEQFKPPQEQHRKENGVVEHDHFVSVSSESYLCELFLKQSVRMELQYVLIGPFNEHEWSQSSSNVIFWKIYISVKRDFEYVDEMKAFVFDVCQRRNHDRKIMFFAADNLRNQKTFLSLSGNICIQIYRCKKTNEKAVQEKEIGAIWIHSHFVPANYDHRSEHVITFEKHEIDGMYKDKKNKGPILPEFHAEIGYQCARNDDEDDDVL